MPKFKFHPENYPLLVTAIGGCATVFLHIDNTQKAAVVLLLGAIGSVAGWTS